MFSADQDATQNLRFVILNTARQLVAEESGRLSIRTLAHRIGCSPGTIYLYFRDKSDLLQCLADENLARLTHLLDGLRERHRRSDPLLLLKKALYTCVEFWLRQPEQYYADPIRPAVPMATLQEFVARCVEEDALRPEVDPEAACVSLCATIHGLTSMVVAGAFQSDRTLVIEQVINISVDGLTERSAKPRVHAASVA